MNSGTFASVRELAFRILVKSANSEAYIEDQVQESGTGLDSRDFARLRYLVTTVVRRKLTLETVLRHFVKRSVEPDLWQLLKLGAAQILFGDADHRHADVNETVEVARAIGKSRWCKFLNGVLRNLDRAILTTTETSSLGRKVYPINSELDLRALSLDLFTDPDVDFPGYISEAFSIPRWLVERWDARQNRSEILRMAGWFLSSPRMCLRVNLHKVSREELLQQFEKAGFSGRAGNIKTSILDVNAASPHELPGWETGYFSIQDETAQHAAPLLDPQPGECVLDLCAAPGTKTLHLAELMGEEGEILATDVSKSRLAKVRENAKRANIDIIRTRCIARDGHDLPEGPFDRILIDAPCTNTGVLGKRIDVRWRLTKSDLEELPALQRELLDRAAVRLRRGGAILYSTCSIEPEENERVVESFLQSHPDFSCTHQQTFLPGAPADGGFQALLVFSNAL
ncbi:MAG: methyltransferase domain-containing protein [Planctomycetaceae bacterium]|nr:methyltransferase domain-containing protein [Planctomycetaceae bacterium]